VLSSEAALRTQLDDLDEASRLLTDAVALLDRHPGIAAVTMANVRMQLGFLESRRGQLRKSLAHLTQAAEELELSPHSFEQSFFCRQSIASVAGQLGYNKQAEALLQSLVQVSTVPGSAADLARLATLVELGNLHMQREEWALAEPIYLRARDEVMAAGSPAKHLCDIRQNLASTYTHTGRFAEAELEFAAAFELAAQLYSPSDPWLAQLHRNRAVLLFRAGRHAEARIDNEKALKVYADCGGPPVPDVADAHMTQAMLFVVESEWEESEYHLRLALSMKNEIYGEGHPATAMPLVKLGLVLYQKRAYTQARPMLTRAIRILEDFHVNAALLSEAHLYLSLVHEATGQHKEAKKARDKSEWYKWNAKNNKEK
jgi:tetratricopeptide (TPR) repeat protein